MLSKLTRGIDRANHHTQLLQTPIDSKRLQRGLIPKVTLKIPDSPGTFTIQWVDSLHNAGLILTEKLRDYLQERAKRLESEYSQISTNLKNLKQSGLMEHNRWYFGTNSQGNKTRTEEKETKAAGYTKKQHSKQSSWQKHNNHGYKKPNPPITNLSNYCLSKNQITTF